ncbi:MAG: hypothetical protein AAGJ08_02850 [Cyanobacteria bacterium P01_H01_bin.35]
MNRKNGLSALSNLSSFSGNFHWENFGKKLSAKSCYFVRKQRKIIRRAELFHSLRANENIADFLLKRDG